jgi:hypothetical protein
MIIKNRLFLLLFTLCTLPSLQANSLAERITDLEQTVRAQGQTIAALAQKLANLTLQTTSQPISLCQIRSLKDFGAWTYGNKATIAKAAVIALGLCTLKRYFKPEASTQAQAALDEAKRLNPHLQINNSSSDETNNPNRHNIIGKTIDRIGDFGMYIAGSTCNLANRALRAVTLTTTN